MLFNILNYLSDPVFFASFAAIIGISYVMVWVVSLKELSKGYSEDFVQGGHGREDGGEPPQPIRGPGARRRNGSGRNARISRVA